MCGLADFDFLCGGEREGGEVLLFTGEEGGCWRSHSRTLPPES